MRANNRLKIYAAIAFLFFLEITLFSKFRIHGASPGLLLIATIFFGFHFGIICGLEAGLISGILKDMFTLTGFGINAFSFLLVGVLAGYLRKKLARENFVTEFFISGSAVYLTSGIYFLDVEAIAGGDVGAGFWAIIFYKGLYTAFVAPLLFFVLRRIFVRLR
ncbi:MAG: rod shape-determining protein MreD [Candidatus Omnitrophota bacterium]